MHGRFGRSALVGVLLLFTLVLQPGAHGQAPAPRTAIPAPLVVDFVALDTTGKPVADLRPTDVSVSINGRPRALVGLDCVWRGPGADAAATLAARRQNGTAGRTVMRADPARTILLAVDESGVPGGGEKPVVALVSALLDGLGPADRLAFARLPEARARPDFTTSRDAIRQQAAHLTGRGAPPDYLARLKDAPPSGFASDDEAPKTAQRLHDAAREAGTAAATPVVSPAASLDGLVRLLSALRDDPGPHVVALVAPPAATGSREADVRAVVNRCLEAAAASRSAVYVVRLASMGAADPGPFARVAQLTGGAVLSLGRNTTADVQHLLLAWSVTYLAELEPAESDIGGLAAPLELTVNKAGVQVRASSRWCPRRDPLPSAVASELGTAGAPTAGPAVALPPAGSPPSAPAPKARQREPITDGELAVVVARATEYVAGYMRDLPNVVAEEDYVQSVERRRFGRYDNFTPVQRHLLSDFLMVTAPGVTGWLPFRDVFEVDGKKVRDREDRLHRIFLEASDTASALRDARLLTDESARFNVGAVGRTINVPTLPLIFLTPGRVGGVNFTRGPEETVEGVRAWRVEFEEWTSPTLIRTATNSDLPAFGTFWVDPLTGRVVRTVVRTATPDVKTEITVFYRRDEKVGFWMPADMRESYENGADEIKGHAVYRNFRRFQVRTEEVIKNPAD